MIIKTANGNLKFNEGKNPLGGSGLFARTRLVRKVIFMWLFGLFVYPFSGRFRLVFCYIIADAASVDWLINPAFVPSRIQPALLPTLHYRPGIIYATPIISSVMRFSVICLYGLRILKERVYKQLVQ